MSSPDGMCPLSTSYVLVKPMAKNKSETKSSGKSLMSGGHIFKNLV